MKKQYRFYGLLVLMAACVSVTLVAAEEKKVTAAHHFFSLPPKKYSNGKVKTEGGWIASYLPGFYFDKVGNMQSYLPSGEDTLWTCGKDGTYHWHTPIPTATITAKNELLGTAQTSGALAVLSGVYGFFRLRSNSNASDGVIAACAGLGFGLFGLAYYAEYNAWRCKKWMNPEQQSKVIKTSKDLGDMRYAAANYDATHRFERLGTVSKGLRPHIRLASATNPITLQSVIASAYSYCQIAYHEE